MSTSTTPSAEQGGTYTETLAALAAAAAAAVLPIHTLLVRLRELAGPDVEVPKIVAGLLRGLLAGYQAKAVALADLALAGQLTAMTRRPVLTLGLAPTSVDEQNAADALEEYFALTTATADDAGVMASAPVLAAAQDAYGHGLTQHAEVEGWTRVTNADACQLCRARR